MSTPTPTIPPLPWSSIGWTLYDAAGVPFANIDSGNGLRDTAIAEIIAQAVNATADALEGGVS